MKRSVSLTILSLLALLVTPWSLRADEIRLNDGRVLEGRIVEVRGAKGAVAPKLVEGRLLAAAGARVVIERPYGFIELAADEIASVTETEDDFDRFDLLRAEAGDDLGLRLELAVWCREHKLRGLMKELVSGILEEEPDLEEAHALLGEVMTDRGWMSVSRARALERMRRAENGRSSMAQSRAAEKSRLRRLEREMRSLAARIYSQSASESERAYLALLELAKRENITGLAPIAARFYRDAGGQRAALAQATVTVNLQQASLLSMRERSLNLGAGGAVRVQLPETRKIGLGTTVSVPLR